MRIETVEYEVYKFNELSEEAKEKVKKWYLNGQESEFFTEDCKEELNYIFNTSDLEVQYSLGYCQGDGFNIYGKISAEDIFNSFDKGIRILENYKDVLTEEEKKEVLAYQENCNYIKLPYNNHYCYSLADYIDIKEDWAYQLECYYDEENIDYKLLEKFENMVRNIFNELNKSFEVNGYSFFYEIEEEDLEEYCEANEYEFLADGTLF